MRKIDRTGEETLNNFGSKMMIKEYRNNKDIDVYFPEYNWIFKHTTYKHFKNGKIKCPYEPRYYGVGYLGEGKYKMSINGKHTDEFDIWYAMLRRCYDPKYHERNPTYKGCEVEDYLLNFQNMCEWLEENYYEVPGRSCVLIKIFFVKGIKFIVETLVYLYLKELIYYLLNVIKVEVIILLVCINYHLVITKRIVIMDMGN